jgi:hypothetical protein
MENRIFPNVPAVNRATRIPLKPLYDKRRTAPLSAAVQVLCRFVGLLIVFGIPQASLPRPGGVSQPSCRWSTVPSAH